LTGNPPLTAPAGREGLSTTGRFLELIEPKLEATESLFHEQLGSDVPFIQEAGEYIFRGGGKRVRPALLLLAAQMLDLETEEDVTYAAAVELIHTATLIHDDIIDHAALRRGQETLNRVWGNSLTVLLGDWLYTTAMHESLRHDNVEVIRALCVATREMTEGELLALQRLGAIDLTVEEYFEIINRKTAKLFAAACSVPSLVPPARPEARAALNRYGEALGMCFQLVDDLLDFTAKEEDLGKPVLSDLKEGKMTLPILLALPRISERERQAIETVLRDRAFNAVSTDEVMEIVVTQGTLDETRERAQTYARQAREALAFFPSSAAREALEFAPDFVLSRRS